MQLRRSILVFLSGCAVYALMTSCSGDEPGRVAGGSASGSGGFGGGSTSAGGHGGAISAGGNGGMAGAGGNGGMAGAGGHGGMAGAGGNGGVLPPGKTTSGTRLKRKYGLGDDGTVDVTLVGREHPQTLWWDSQLQTNCTYVLASDGELRCLPAPELYGDRLFADDQCTVPVIALSHYKKVSCPQSPQYARWEDYVLCLTKPTHVSSLGSEAPGPCFYVASPGGCTGWTCSPQDQVMYFEVAELPASSLVAGTPGRDP
jgi:hypothetical protein